ncbi:polyprenyl diphosphate synthase [Solihabitans fulvus]|uniref:polyprenyl diphosphate synthase n=1 Tax=Solihabitans fulvus TaxID=1892852 RepID=UPI001CB763F4|nr:polyprenyl diphosphate synthase [Solihabitans fulvus]
MHRKAHLASYLGVELLSAQKRPYLHALCAFAAATDQIVDTTRAADARRTFDAWRARTMDDLNASRSAHPVRRALVHTVRMWDLDAAVIAEMLGAYDNDLRRPVSFATFDDLRAFLRGVGGTVAALAAPVLEPTDDDPAAARLMSVLGEAFQMTDIFQDFTEDLPNGKCYLPQCDLEDMGLTQHDLTRGRRSPALDAFIDRQASRADALLAEGAESVPLMHPSSQPFLQCAVTGMRTLLDEVRRRKSAVLWERIRLQLPRTVPVPELSVVPRQRGVLRRGLSRVAARFAPLPATVPRHVAVIMDGNRRWAVARGLPPSAGHSAGERNAWPLVDEALVLGVSHLTLFAFSTENWSREAEEVAELMELLSDSVRRQLPGFVDRGIRVRWCGRRDRIADSLRAQLEDAERRTSANNRLTMTFALDYGGRTEIVDAARRLAVEATEGRVALTEVTEDGFRRYLYEPDLPDVDLLIRTSGEQRISNFLPWQAAYAEIVFAEALWPDFDPAQFRQAVAEYARRDRRFGAQAKADQVVR